MAIGSVRGTPIARISTGLFGINQPPSTRTEKLQSRYDTSYWILKAVLTVHEPWHSQSASSSELLIPFPDTPDFVACDEYGKIYFISGGRSKSLHVYPLRDRVSQIVYGAIPTTDNAVVLVRNPHAVSSYSRVDIIAHGYRNGQTIRELKPLGGLEKVLNPHTCGMAIRKVSDGTFVITCRPDG